MEYKPLNRLDIGWTAQVACLLEGTTADLTAAAIFVFLLQNDLDAWHKVRLT